MTRTPEYFVMRTCERWRLREGAFALLTVEEQARLLAWERIRLEEERGAR